jgi:tRNA A-37 threonylcarbamoyl transferase component Bud32
MRFCPDDGTPLTETAAATAATPTGQPARSRHLELPAVLGGRYRLEEVRGGGGMAKVYRAVDLTLEREVAVKLINPELRAEPEFDARFQREARIASQLSDPHIVVVHDFGLDAEHGPYLVMEFLKGQSVRERLRAEGPLPLKAALQMSAQMLLALIHAHDKGIVHRDIKPDNVFLLNQSGVRLHVRVLDFGIARIYRRDEAAQHETLTRPGAVLGTPRYMSPEQLAGQAVDVRSDLYSAAMVIHEALTGQLPFVTGKKLSELCPEATPALEALLERCLRPNPTERPASAIEAYLQLQELGKASGVLLLPPGAMDKLMAARQSQEPTVDYVPGESARPPWRRRLLRGLARRRFLWSGVGVAVGVMLALGAGFGVPALFNWLKPGLLVPARESLLGVEIGATRDAVVAAIGKAPESARRGNPWAGDLKEALGYVLKPADLAGDPAALEALDVLCWWDQKVCVILRENLVRAVVVRDISKVASGRQVAIGAGEAVVLHAYASEVPDTEPIPEPPRGEARARSATRDRVYRYDALGIGFEVRREKVAAITLYPPEP